MYRITLDEEQMRLIYSAMQLQMRVRKGQGWAITDNIVRITQPDYRQVKDYTDPILDAALKRVAMPCYELRKNNAQTWRDEYDIWKGIQVALKGQKEVIYAMSVRGVPKIQKLITEEKA